MDHLPTDRWSQPGTANAGKLWPEKTRLHSVAHLGQETQQIKTKNRKL